MRNPALLIIILLLLLPSFSPLIHAQQTVNLNATVPANPSDFSADLITTTTGDEFPQDTTLSYELTYGSSLSYASTITVEANWSRGTIEGDSSPTVSVLEYVSGSASNAYNNTPPVIDPVNRTIKWTITSFPANTENEKVTFNLKTTNSYTGDNKVSFSVSGRVLGPGTSTADSTVTNTYLYDISLAPTPTPTPTATPTPTSRPTSPTGTQSPSPTPTPDVPVSNTINSVVIRQITASRADIFATTSLPSSISLLYGVSPTTLTQRMTVNTPRTQHSFSLSNLLPNTQYYFLIQATTNSGSITSDIYTFTTAKIPPLSSPNISSIVVTSGDTILLNNSTVHDDSFNLMLPTAISYTLRLNVSEIDTLSEIILFSRNQESQEEGEIAMSEVKNGTYQGRIFSSQKPSRQDLLVRLISRDGSVTERKLGEVRVVSPMKLVNERTQEAIEGGRVKLSYWNSRENRFVPLDSNLIPQSTLYSANNGTVPFILPEGRYKAEVSHMGFETQEFTFTIGNDAEAGYPTIQLKETGFNLLLLLTYLWTITKDFFNGLTNSYLDPLTSSVRFYHLLAATTLLALSSITLFSFFSRSKLTPAILPIFLLYHFKKSHHNETISVNGIVVDHETSHPLAHANVYLFEEHSDKIVAHSVSSLQGKYHFNNIPLGQYRISVLKTGFHPFVVHKSLTQHDTSQLHLAVSRKESPLSLSQKVLHLAEEFFSSTFEAWLLLSFVLLMLVGMSIGWEKIIGFFAIALFNLTVWSIHRAHTYRV